MAGFQLSINGRFWVSTEAQDGGNGRLKSREDLERVADESRNAEHHTDSGSTPQRALNCVRR